MRSEASLLDVTIHPLALQTIGDVGAMPCRAIIMMHVRHCADDQSHLDKAVAMPNESWAYLGIRMRACAALSPASTLLTCEAGRPLADLKHLACAQAHQQRGSCIVCRQVSKQDPGPSGAQGPSGACRCH